MKLKLIDSIELKQKALKSSVSLLSVPKNAEVTIVGKKIKYDNNTPFLKVKYNNTTGFVNAKYLLGLFIDVKNTGNKKWPKKATIANGTEKFKIKIPQQTQFGTFCKLHGCSVAAVTTALQMHDKLMSPSEVHSYAKSFLNGYTGSKLTIYGCYKVINKKCPGKAVWKPFTGDNKSKVKENIENAVKKGYFVLFEQKNPIHTNTIIGRAANGKYVIATNGTVKKVTLNYLIKKALKGYKSEKKQRNWWAGSQYGAGYVIVKK